MLNFIKRNLCIFKSVYLVVVAIPVYSFAQNEQLPLSAVDALVESRALDYTDWVKVSNQQYSAVKYREPVTFKYAFTDNRLAITAMLDTGTKYEYTHMDLANQCYRLAYVVVKDGWGDPDSWDNNYSGDALLTHKLLKRLDDDTVKGFEKVQINQGSVSVDHTGRKYTCWFTIK